MNCTIHLAKTKALISFAVTAKLICGFVFAYAALQIVGLLMMCLICDVSQEKQTSSEQFSFKKVYGYSSRNMKKFELFIFISHPMSDLPLLRQDEHLSPT